MLSSTTAVEKSLSMYNKILVPDGRNLGQKTLSDAFLLYFYAREFSTIIISYKPTDRKAKKPVDK